MSLRGLVLCASYDATNLCEESCAAIGKRRPFADRDAKLSSVKLLWRTTEEKVMFSSLCEQSAKRQHAWLFGVAGHYLNGSNAG